MLDQCAQTFTSEDVLMSRTDARGVIVACNGVFQRISGYDWADLKGAPHKVVRHPDMPRAVFHLMWQRLKDGEPISAMVKNKTKGGGHYWVFATAYPIGEEYISVRIKPTDDTIAAIEPVYARVRQAELEQKLSPKESLALLMEEIKGLGGNGYDDLIARLGARKWIDRNANLGRRRDRTIEHLFEVLKEWDKVQKMCVEILSRHGHFESSPLNLRIQASQLGDRGRSLDVIASSFTDLAHEMQISMRNFENRVSIVSNAVRHSIYLLCMDRLMSEAEEEIGAEVIRADVAEQDLSASEREWRALHGESAEVLRAVSRELNVNSADKLREMRRQFDAFAKDLQATRRHLTSLSLTRVMSAIENAQLQSGSVAAIIGEIEKFQDISSKTMARINSQFNVMQRRI